MIWFNTKTQQAETDLCCLINPVVCRRCKAEQKFCAGCYTEQDFMMQEQIRLGIWTCKACEPRDWNKIFFALNLGAVVLNVALAIINIGRGRIGLSEINSLCAIVSLIGAFQVISDPF